MTTSRLKEWEARLIAERNTTQVTARCAWCPWQLIGTVQATRDAHAAHRELEHPDVLPKPRKLRDRPFRQLISGKTLDDNVAGARAQGAAGWAGPE